MGHLLRLREQRLDPTEVEDTPAHMSDAARSTFAGVNKVANGIVFCGSLIRPSDVTDGTSNTYLIGEKYCNPVFYETGGDAGDNEAALIGDNEDTSRWSIGLAPDLSTAIEIPMVDTEGYTSRRIFGSPHSDVFNMAFCDGSVQGISYTIDPKVHEYLGNRQDGMAVDPKKL